MFSKDVNADGEIANIFRQSSDNQQPWSRNIQGVLELLQCSESFLPVCTCVCVCVRGLYVLHSAVSSSEKQQAALLESAAAFPSAGRALTRKHTRQALIVYRAKLRPL